jgi:phosphohistidine phosphatase
MKRLLVMRHAKSDWTHAVPDHERPLNDRGMRNAPAMGRALAAMGAAPDHVLTSTAVRAATTVELAAEAGAWDCAIERRPGLYGASAQGTLEELLEVDDDHDTVMVVGHQPTWGSLVFELTGARAQMRTATVAGIDLGISSWSQAPRARGELAFLLQPRMLERLV